MWISILIACGLITCTIAIHAFFTSLALGHVDKIDQNPKNHWLIKLNENYSGTARLIFITRIVIIMFFASIVEAIVWALMFEYLGALDSFEDSLYFSIVTFTTLGYGDVILNESWRLLGAFEAAIGIIIFGWSTAVVMSAVTRTYSNK